MSPADVRFGIYLTIEEMEAAAKALADEHARCGDDCAPRRVAKRLVTAAIDAREAIGC